MILKNKEILVYNPDYVMALNQVFRLSPGNLIKVFQVHLKVTGRFENKGHARLCKIIAHVCYFELFTFLGRTRTLNQFTCI